MVVWKGAQLIFGLHVALIVSRVGISNMQTFDETGSQIFAISATGIILVIGFIIILLRNEENENYFYTVLSIGILLITNIVLAANVLPRLLAVYRGDEEKFKLTEEERFTNELKKRTRRRSHNFMKDVYMEEAQHLKSTKETNAIVKESDYESEN